MSDPEQHAARTESRLSGEDAPTWVTAAFAAIGTLVAGAAVWLALMAQPTPPAQVAGSEAPSAADSALVQAPRPEAHSASGPAASGSIAGGDAATTTASAPEASAVTPSATSPDDSRPAQLAATSGSGREEECPPPLEIPFRTASARPITKDVETALGELQAFLGRHPQAKLSIEGHADAVGTENYNVLLSYRRAKAVVSLLGQSGLADKRMVIRAAGNSMPIEGLPPDSGKNRRVVLKIVGIESCQQADDVTSQ